MSLTCLLCFLYVRVLTVCGEAGTVLRSPGHGRASLPGPSLGSRGPGPAVVLGGGSWRPCVHVHTMPPAPPSPRLPSQVAGSPYVSSSHFKRSAARILKDQQPDPRARACCLPRFLSQGESEIGFHSRRPVFARALPQAVSTCLSSTGPLPLEGDVASRPPAEPLPSPGFPRCAVVASRSACLTPTLAVGGRARREAPERDAEPPGPCPRRWPAGLTLGGA